MCKTILVLIDIPVYLEGEKEGEDKKGREEERREGTEGDTRREGWEARGGRGGAAWENTFI